MRAAFEVDSFEYVEVGDGAALLRLAGRWQGGRLPVSATLVAVSGGERAVLPELPPGPRAADDGLWRAAFSASPRLLGAAFELDPPSGAPIPLPAPTQHEPPPASDEQPEDDAPDEATAPELAAAADPDAKDAKAAPQPSRRFGRRRSASGAAPTDATSAADAPTAYASTDVPQAEALKAIRAELEVVRRTLALELDAVREQLESTKEELDTANRHLDTLHEAHGLELTSARRGRDAANERSEKLERALAETREQLADRERVIEVARAEAARASQESAELEAAVGRLRDEISDRAREAAASEHQRIEHHSEELERARDEVRQGAARIAALERHAVALSEAIHEHLPSPPSPLQKALPLEPFEDDQAEPDAPPVGAAPPA